MAELKISGFAEELSGNWQGLAVILGPNGAGKTTLLEGLHGMRPTMDVKWDNVPAAESKATRGFVSQSPIMLAGSVRYNLQTAGKLLGLPEDEQETLILQIAQALGFKELLRRDPATLSGGERALISLGRAELSQAKTLLLDEVTAHLDPENTKAIETAMRSFADQPDHLVFFVTHSIVQAKRLADRIIFVDHANILYQGDARTFWQSKNPRIQKYLEGEI